METILIIISIIAIIQSVFTIFSMLYAWNSTDNPEEPASPKYYEKPFHSFTILVPAWHEENVIAQTITAIANIKYPPELSQILILLRPQDVDTVRIAKETLEVLNRNNLSIILVDDLPRNKPNQLNWGLASSTGEIITIFDAEDEPSPEILNIANTEFINKKLDILQIGVQLMNYDSNWFSTLNVLEYFFWFKSSLLLFSKSNVIPLGGNSAFIKTQLVRDVGGWNEDSLTEDCELGLRLSQKDIKISVIYDPIHSTREETPLSTSEFIKQRTRWTQGFIEILRNGEWSKQSSIYKKLVSLYLLSWPLLQSFLFVYIVFAVMLLPFLKISLVVSVFAVFPIFLLFLQLVFLNLGLWIFTNEYKIKYNPWSIPKIFITFVPYQAVLTYASIRAFIRNIKTQTEWEKTAHFNQHRTST
jgi:glycosyltransferase XagB